MTGFEDALQQYGPIATVIIAAALTFLSVIRASGTAHLKAAMADGETQSVVAKLALAGDMRATELVATNKEVTDLRVQIARMQGDIKVLKAKEARIPVLEEQIKLLTAQITELQTTYTTQIEVLERKYNEERQQNTFLMEENARLKSEVIPALEQKIDLLRARVTELEEKLSRLKSEKEEKNE